MKQEDRRLNRKVRNSYIISTVSIAMVLFLLGAVSFLIFNAMKASDRLRESISVYVMIADGTESEQILTLQKSIEAMPEVKKITFIPKARAAAEFKEYIGDDFEEFLQDNPLPDSFEIGMTAEASDKTSVAAFEKRVGAMEGVDDVLYQKNIVEQIGTNINKFNLMILLFGGALLVISLILLNNTLRMTIAARRHIINTMKLVGATRMFITKPFLLSAARHGLYAGIIASLMFVGMEAGLRQGLPEINMAEGILPLCIIGGMLLGGMIISVLFTALAVSKFIKMPAGKIHMY